MQKCQKIVRNFWRFIVVGPFSTEDPNKKKNQHTAEQPGKTPKPQFAPQDRGAQRRRERRRTITKKGEAAEEKNKNKKKNKKNKKKKKKQKSKKAKKNKEGEKK